MSGDELVVFDNELLDSSAAELRAAYPMEDLRATLESGLVDRDAFGEIPGANEAHGRLKQTFDGTLTGVKRTDVDVHRLAADAMTAAQEARDAKEEAWRRAMEAHSVVVPGPAGLAMGLMSVAPRPTQGWGRN